MHEGLPFTREERPAEEMQKFQQILDSLQTEYTLTPEQEKLDKTVESVAGQLETWSQTAHSDADPELVKLASAKAVSGLRNIMFYSGTDVKAEDVPGKFSLFRDVAALVLVNQQLVNQGNGPLGKGITTKAQFNAACEQLAQNQAFQNRLCEMEKNPAKLEQLVSNPRRMAEFINYAVASEKIANGVKGKAAERTPVKAEKNAVQSVPGKH